MMMAMISPSRREVSPVEQLCRSPRLVPPRFRLMAAESRPEKFLLTFFSHRKTSYRRRWTSKSHQGAHEVGGRAPHLREQGVGPLAFIFGEDFSLFILRCSVEFQDFWSCAE